jgi:hypothetical protein
MNGFPVSKALVIETAKNVIAAIQKDRDDAFKGEVDKLMARRFFRPDSREEAEVFVRENSRRVAAWRIASWGTMGQAKELLAAANVSIGETVYLSREDAAFVNRWGTVQ